MRQQAVRLGAVLTKGSKVHGSRSSFDNDEENLVSTTPSSTQTYVTGWRLLLTTIGVLLCLYLVNIEVTIVSTSLITITDDLHGFSKTSWIVTGYLITYTGFIIIWSKLSDIIGRKKAINATMIIFVAFSAGCGGSRTLNQLIICRAFQGVGAAGAYSMSILTVYEMVPQHKLAIYGALISVSIALATVTGPLFGGLIDKSSTWRWVFYFNLPTGALAIALLALAMPGSVGPSFIGYSSRPKRDSSSLLSRSLRRLDLVGAVLLLSGSLLLVTALVEATIHFAWSSAAIITMLVLSTLSWTTFFVWEWYITFKDGLQEPIFPWRFVFNRPWMGMLITTFLVGVPFNVVIVSLPQRFQAVSNTSALGAGIRLIPYSVVAALGSAVANVLCAKAKIPLLYFLLLGAVLHVLGLTLLSTISSTGPFPAAGYGYEVLAGAGVGITFGVLILAVPYTVEARDLAVATGAVIQFRFLGGAIGLSIVSSILNGMLKSQLRGILPARELASLLESTEVISTFTPTVRNKVLEVFAQNYQVQFRIMIGFAAAQIPAAALLWRRGEQLKAA